MGGRAGFRLRRGARPRLLSEEAGMANKDKGGKSNKKVATQDLKEKRAAKKSKKAEKAKNARSSE
jgi:hypothetical protein